MESRIRPSQEEISEGFSKLSRRESEVLALLLNGLTASEIGISLFISARTVESHLQHVYAKLDVHTKRQAIDKVVQQTRLWAPGDPWNLGRIAPT